jgi:ferredoxin
VDIERIKALFTQLGERVAALPERDALQAIEGMIDGTAYQAPNPMSRDDDERVTVCRVCQGVEGCETDCPAGALWSML